MKVEMNFGTEFKILDACCGSRMMWFDKNNKDTLYMDIREEESILCNGSKLIVRPDLIGDVTSMNFNDESFYLVVLDPPHLLHAGETSWIRKKYGVLPKDWQSFIKKSFSECLRVLKKNGTLVMKWSDHQIHTKDVLKIIDQNPLFGHRRGATVFLVFFKSE